MTTTPPLPDEPEDPREDAQQALDDLYTKPRQDEAGQTAYAAVPPPLPPAPPQPPTGQPTGQQQTGQPDGQEFDWQINQAAGQQQFRQPTDQQQQYGQAGGQRFSQPSGQDYGQGYGQGYEQQFGQTTGQTTGQSTGQSTGQPAGQQYGESAGAPQYGQQQPEFGQPSGQQFGQPSGQQQQFGQVPPGGGSPYGQYPSAPPPPDPYGTGYGYGQQMSGAPGMPAFAGWWQRVGAWLLDNFLIGFALELIVSWSDNSALRAVGGLIGLGWALYNAFLAGKSGQSYGKRAVNIRLARLEDGMPVGGGYGLLRWLMNTVFWLLCLVPGVLNYLWPLWDSKHQTWSDKIANSVVVRA